MAPAKSKSGGARKSSSRTKRTAAARREPTSQGASPAPNPERTAPETVDEVESTKLAQSAEELGYIGTKVDPRPNSEHSLESGPDGPSIVDQALDGKHAEAAALEASAK